MKILIDKELRAANTYTFEDIHDNWHELNVIDRTGQAIMTEMTGTPVICLTTRTADFTVVQDTHARIEKSTYFGLITFVCRL